MATQATARKQQLPTYNYSSSALTKSMRRYMLGATATLFTVMLLIVYLAPFGYMTSTAFKDRQQMAKPGAPMIPSREKTFSYEGEDHPVYLVPIGDDIKEWALVKPGRKESSFVDINNPEAGLIQWEGQWRTLKSVWEFDPRTENAKEVWETIDFPRLLFNTAAIAFLGVVGTLISCTLVAYGFSRFRIPGKGILFMLLVATIILPRQVTLVPTFIFYAKVLHWTGTWLPLIVPHFFANAYNVFLLRQYFMTIPRELDEAAMIDGASPLRVLVSVILPQSMPAIAAVTVFHTVFAWNDFFEPYLYLAGKPELQPISVGIQTFRALYDQQPHLIQMAALMSLALPVLLFFMAQRYFIGGIVVTGVDK